MTFGLRGAVVPTRIFRSARNEFGRFYLLRDRFAIAGTEFRGRLDDQPSHASAGSRARLRPSHPGRVSSERDDDSRLSRGAEAAPQPEARGRGSGSVRGADKAHGYRLRTPTTLAARGTIEFRGATRVLKVVLEAAAEGDGREIHLGERPPALAPPPATPPATSPIAPAAPIVPTEPAASPVASTLDLEGLLRATPQEVDRREGLPGQRPMVLKDALHGEDWIWLRFLLEGGAGEQVDRVWWEQGDIKTYVQEVAGKDLRIVVQVPGGEFRRRPAFP